jgi:hypothetical protein
MHIGYWWESQKETSGENYRTVYEAPHYYALLSVLCRCPGILLTHLQCILFSQSDETVDLFFFRNANMKTTLSLDVTPCSLVEWYGCFGSLLPLLP